jgi:hypothetical protein
MKRLNIGCGTDKRDGFINIDGSECVNPDIVMRIELEDLVYRFGENTVDYILANDVIEHLFHWEAVKILKEFYSLLNAGGCLEIRVPDTKRIIETDEMPIEDKIFFLYGRQDINRPGGWNLEQDLSRKMHPDFFCHKFGWTKKSLSDLLIEIGFKHTEILEDGFNFICKSYK